jgi:hypothetical protein
LSRQRPVQLSILIGTNRPSLLACSRIAQACSWAGPNVEVIVRDNSGDARKRALLSQFHQDNCKIIIAEPCDALTNASEILKLAKGDFVFLLADDDFGFDHAVASLPGMIEQTGSDQSVAGITGLYAVEFANRSAVVEYKNIDSDNVELRVAGFLTYGGPNVMIYAPVRRELFQRVFSFTNTLPFLCSFHDQIICLLYLLNGRFARLNRLLYLYDMGPWEIDETAQKRDLEFYKAAGFDPAINKLHWLLCAFEGAALVRNIDIFPVIPLTSRQKIADLWFSSMFLRFKGHSRYTFDSPFTGEAEKLCAKLQAATGQLSFHDILSEISEFVALLSKTRAQAYFDFWDAILSKRKPIRQDVASPKLMAAGGA